MIPRFISPRIKMIPRFTRPHQWVKEINKVEDVRQTLYVIKKMITASLFTEKTTKKQVDTRRKE